MAAPQPLLLAGGRVVSMAAGRPRSEDADLLIVDGRIAAIGPGLAAGGDVRRVDVAGRLVLPGFVDAHRHAWQTAIRGVAADWSLHEYVRHIRLGYARAYRPQDVHASQLVGALEALDAGITTMCDHCHVMNGPEHADAALDGFVASGIRGVLSYGFYDVPLDVPAYASHDDRIRDLTRWVERFGAARHGPLVPGVALTEAGLVTEAQTRAEIEAARALGLRITAHMGTLSTPDAVARLARQGLLGPDMLHVHCNFSGDDELLRIRDTGGHVCVTPETELQMGMGFPVIGRLAAIGMRAALGVDIVSACSGDLFGQMRLGLQAERALRNQPTLDERKMPATVSPTVLDALRWATVDGAAALGLADRVGTLEPGRLADVITLRTDGLHFAPPAEAVAAVVLQCRASDVADVLVGGRFVKRDGTLLGADLPRLRARVAESAAHVARAASTSATATATTRAYDRAISSIVAS